MVYRTLLALLLVAAVLPAQESVKDAYKHAKRLRGDARSEYAAQQAAEYDGKVSWRKPTTRSAPSSRAAKARRTGRSSW